MNQKEFELLAYVIADRKRNAYESLKFGYTKKDIQPVLLTLLDFEDMLANELESEYSSFDRGKFVKACRVVK